MKILRIAGLAAALALCAGCARSRPASESAAPAPGASVSEPAAAAERTAEGELTFYDSLDGAARTEGFYRLRPGAGTGSVLCRLDPATGHSAAVCAVAGCAHDTQACPAYFGCYANLPVVLPWQEGLLLVFPGNPFAGPPEGEADLPRVELAGADGTGRRTLAVFSPDEQLAAGFAVDDARLYFLSSTVQGQTSQPAWALKSVDLATGQTDTLTRFGGESMAVGYYLVGCTGEGLVLKRIETTGPLEPSRESVASNVHSLLLVDREGNVLRPLKQWRQDEIAACVSGGELFYCDGESRLFRNSLDGGDDRLAARLPAAVRPGSVSFGAGSPPWLSLTGRDEAGRTFRWLCNTRTGEVVDWAGAEGERRLVWLGQEWSLTENTPPGAGEARMERVATADLLAGKGAFIPVE